MSAIPYNFRICGALPDHEPVELFRSRRTYAPSYFNAVTRDFSPEWSCWVETRMPDYRTLGGRIKPPRYMGSDKIKLHLDPEDKRRIGA